MITSLHVLFQREDSFASCFFPKVSILSIWNNGTEHSTRPRIHTVVASHAKNQKFTPHPSPLQIVIENQGNTIYFLSSCPIADIKLSSCAMVPTSQHLSSYDMEMGRAAPSLLPYATSFRVGRGTQSLTQGSNLEIPIKKH